MKSLMSFILITTLCFSLTIHADHDSFYQPANLSLSVQHRGPSTVPANAQITYEIEVLNDTEHSAHKTFVYAYLHGAKFHSASGNGVYDSATDAVIWNFGKMVPGARHIFKYQVTSGALIGDYTVCAYAEAKFLDCVSSTIVKPNLSCTVELPANCSTLESIEGTFTLYNSGKLKAEDLNIRIELDNLKFLDDMSSVKVLTGNLDAGKKLVKTFKLKAIADGTAQMSSVVTCANAVGTQCQDITAVKTPELTIQKFAPPLAYVDSYFVYTVTVKNIGNARATKTRLKDSLPKGVEFAGCTDGGNYDKKYRSVNWYLGTLSPNEIRTVRIKVKGIKQNMTSGWKNIAAVKCAELGVRKAHAITKLDIVPALNINIVDDIDPVRVGDSVIYAVAVFNEGKEEATDVIITFDVPEEGEYVSYTVDVKNSPKTLSANYSDGRVTCNTIPVLKPREGVVLKVKVKATKAGSALGTATASFKEFAKPFVAQEPTTFYEDE